MRFVTGCRGRWVWWLAGLTGWCGVVLAEPARPATVPLTLVQPLGSVSSADAVAEHFRHRLGHLLGETVQHRRQEPARGIDALRWAAQAPAQSTLVLMPALLYGQLQESDGMDGGDDAWFTPLQSVQSISWCLVVPDLPQVRNYDSFHAWLVSLRHRVRVGVPGNAGFVRIWLRAMEIKTGLEWEPHLVSVARQGLQDLQERRIDLMVERCDDIYAVRQRFPAGALSWRVLLRNGTSKALAEVPSFTSWQMPPLSAGWLVWMAPRSMPAQRKEQLYEALHSIMGQPETQHLIAEHYNQPLPWNRSQTVQWVREQESSWKGLLELLDHRR